MDLIKFSSYTKMSTSSSKTPILIVVKLFTTTNVHEFVESHPMNPEKKKKLSLWVETNFIKRKPRFARI